MKKNWAACFVLTLGLVIPEISQTRGTLFIIGGGDRPESMMRRFVELSGRSGNGKIVVFPMASSEPEGTGAVLVSEFRQLGARQVECHVLTREQALSEDSPRLLDGAGGVFFSGGDQSRHMAVLLNTPLHTRLLELYRQGCVMAGTSAGAAVMSEIMITGEERRQPEDGHEFETLEAANNVTTPGLGFIRSAIIDQHFVTRKRHNRLISLMAEHPSLLGIGIDEGTAIIVGPDETFEVIGEKSVVVYDAFTAGVRILPSRLIALRGVAMHVLVAGDRFDLRSRKALR